MMRAKKESQQEAAIAHISVVECKNTVNDLNAKRITLENKVNAV
jgi:hypothetical protein